MSRKPAEEKKKPGRKPKAKAPPVEQHSSILYSELAKTSIGNTELYNLYAVVIDATRPYNKPDKGAVMLKVVDPSLNIRHPRDPTDLSNGYATVSIYAQTADKLPHIKRVGDIIRIYKANVSTFKNVKQFIVNMRLGSQWAIFDGFGGGEEQKEEGKEESDLDSCFSFFNKPKPAAPASSNGPYKFSSKEFTYTVEDR